MFIEQPLPHNKDVKVIRLISMSKIHDDIPPGMYVVGYDPSGPYMKKVDAFDDEIVPYASQQAILDEIEQFANARHMYESLGFKWTRGFLLHGAPGCGKTATMRLAVRDWIARGGIVIDVGESGVGNVDAFKIDSPIMFMIDDVDQLDEDDQTTLTHLMDGMEDRRGVWIATTNFLDEVQERLRRKGRFDREIETVPPPKEDSEISIDALPITDEQKEVIKSLITPEMTPAEIREVVIQTVILK